MRWTLRRRGEVGEEGERIWPTREREVGALEGKQKDEVSASVD
jgi:hypothetical protein